MLADFQTCLLVSQNFISIGTAILEEFSIKHRNMRFLYIRLYYALFL